MTTGGRDKEPGRSAIDPILDSQTEVFMLDRRDFIRNLIVGGGATMVLSQQLSETALAEFVRATAVSRADGPWELIMPQILSRIKAPAFPDREFVISKFDAVADGKTDCTEAFSRAIAACNVAGGGRVVVPAGEFLTGAIHLKSNVNLHVTKDATIKFSRDPKHYLPVVFTRWEGMELLNYSPF